MNYQIFRKLGKELYLEANFKMRKDIRRLLLQAYERERKKLAKEAIKVILENAKIAERDKVPICQDTGYPIFFLEIGKIKLDLKKVKDALTEGIREATIDGYLRSSVLSDPLRRQGISPNIPPILHVEASGRKGIKITLLVKGFGSENQTKLVMLKPNAGEDEIIEAVKEHVKGVGSRACPPYIIGIGIGGTSDIALMYSKKATLLEMDKKSKDPKIARLESEIKKRVNKLGIGPLGVGGYTTCLGVRILTHPTHIAGLPLAISLGCHATRSASRILNLRL